MLYNQERRPSPTDLPEVGRQMDPYLFVNEEGFVPEEYMNLIPENMIPMALEAEVGEQLIVEDGEEVIWLFIQHIHVDDNEEEENQTAVMEEDNGWVHNVEEDDGDDDEANYEHAEIVTGTGELSVVGFWLFNRGLLCPSIQHICCNNRILLKNPCRLCGS